MDDKKLVKVFFIFYGIIVLAMLGLVSFMLSSCTLSINLIHTSGTAEDMVDATQTSNPSIDPNLPIQLK